MSGATLEGRSSVVRDPRFWGRDCVTFDTDRRGATGGVPTEEIPSRAPVGRHLKGFACCSASPLPRPLSAGGSVEAPRPGVESQGCTSPKYTPPTTSCNYSPLTCAFARRRRFFAPFARKLRLLTCWSQPCNSCWLPGQNLWISRGSVPLSRTSLTNRSQRNRDSELSAMAPTAETEAILAVRRRPPRARPTSSRPGLRTSLCEGAA